MARLTIDPRVLIIGEAPGKRDTGVTPLWGSSPAHAGWRLRKLAGLDRTSWRLVRRVNLLATLPEGGWDRELAHHTAAAWSHAMLHEQRVILLGTRVRTAFGIDRHLPVCTWTEQFHGCRVACIPHPSGRNIAYNDGKTREKVGTFLREALLGKNSPR